MSRRNNGPKFEELSDDETEYMSHSTGRVEDPDEVPLHRPKRSKSTRREDHRDDPSYRSREHGFGMMQSLFNDPFFSSPFDSMFKHTRDIFQEHSRMMDRMHVDFDRNPSNGNVYCYSSTTTTSSNGVSKTKKTVMDSRTGQEKVSVVKSVGDKRYMMEKIKDREGKEQVTKRYENVTEGDDFKREWKERSKDLPNFQSNRRPSHFRGLENDRRATHRALGVDSSMRKK